MSTNETKPTPGPYLVLCEDETCYRVVSDNYGCIALLHDPLAVEHGREDELEANATLIRHAFDVHHETGLTPRQLAEQREELKRTIHEVELVLAEFEDDMPEEIDKLKRALSKLRATGK